MRTNLKLSAEALHRLRRPSEGIIHTLKRSELRLSRLRDLKHSKSIPGRKAEISRLGSDVKHLRALVRKLRERVGDEPEMGLLGNPDFAAGVASTGRPPDATYGGKVVPLFPQASGKNRFGRRRLGLLALLAATSLAAGAWGLRHKQPEALPALPPRPSLREALPESGVPVPRPPSRAGKVSSESSRFAIAGSEALKPPARAGKTLVPAESEPPRQRPARPSASSEAPLFDALPQADLSLETVKQVISSQHEGRKEISASEVEALAKAFVNGAKGTGLSAGFALAQAQIETSAGARAYDNNNLFGIKRGAGSAKYESRQDSISHYFKVAQRMAKEQGSGYFSMYYLGKNQSKLEPDEEKQVDDYKNAVGSTVEYYRGLEAKARAARKE